MKLIIITGSPCTGKTLLSAILSERYSVPAFGKDMLKESLADTLHYNDDALSRELGIAAEELLYVVAAELLRVGMSVIIEGTFRNEHARGPIAALAARYSPEVVQIQCVAAPDILLERYRSRAGRHSIHPPLDGTGIFEEDMRRGNYEPLDIPGIIITLDTTNIPAIDYSEIYHALDNSVAK